ncbi:MAG TPA: hypothetical protein VH374_02810 [Polyangia bacterium]|jgi:hypothetical protein|nr:hypothetical protein [Polyangia bacterium]
MTRITEEIADLLVRQELFCGMRDIINANDATTKPNFLVEWMMRNHTDAISVGIRRLCDLGRISKRVDVVSLGRLLAEMIQYPHSITRRAHHSRYKNSSDRANYTFDRIVGKKHRFAPAAMFWADLRKLGLTSSRIRRLVDKRIAHATPTRAIRKYPTYGQISAALELLDSLACKYNILLTASYFDTCKPVLVQNWKNPLHVPWIETKSVARAV